MGVLPMLQFTNSFTYFIHRNRRQSLGAAPYCLHVIFAHGKETERKRLILREEMLWHDPHHYYDQKFLRFDPHIPAQLWREGGFELITTQLRQFHNAVRLAQLSNRTLILPRLKCGERPMAYPCHAWYHRAMMYFGLNNQKVPMPDPCPAYYWLNAHMIERLNVPLVESSLLQNRRTPSHIPSDVATLHFCGSASRKSGCERSGQDLDAEEGAKRNRGVVASVGGAVVFRPGISSISQLRQAFSMMAGSSVVTLRNLQHLSVPEGWLNQAGTLKAKELSDLSRNMWCTGCAVTRRGAVISEVNRSVVHEMEQFCRTEARGRLGLTDFMSCCSSSGGPCHQCRSWERRPLNVTNEGWAVNAWMPLWSQLEYPAQYKEKAGTRFICKHPLCSGTDRKLFP